EPRIDGPSQLRVSGRNPVFELLVQIWQGLRHVIDFDLEEGGGRIAPKVRAVQVEAALVEERVGQARQVPPQLFGDRSEVGFQTEWRAPAAMAAVEHHG